MNAKRCEALMAGHDATLEVSDELLQDAIDNHGFVCTADIDKIKDCNFYVVAVPTPVDENNNPDLTPLYGASTTVGKVISKGDVVVYESTIKYGQTITETVLASAEEPINEYLLSISSKSWVSGWSSPEYSHYDEAGNYITTVNFEEYPIVKDTVFYAIFTCKVDDLPEKDVDLGNYF